MNFPDFAQVDIANSISMVGVARRGVASASIDCHEMEVGHLLRATPFRVGTEAEATPMDATRMGATSMGATLNI